MGNNQVKGYKENRTRRVRFFAVYRKNCSCPYGTEIVVSSVIFRRKVVLP